MTGTGRLRNAVISVAVVGLIATACEWNFETLDGHQNGPNGQVNAQVGQQGDAILYNGRPHVFYWDNDNRDLRHAYFNGTFWAFEVLDGHQNGPNGQINTDVGQYNAAVLYNGRPHVFYRNEAGGDLRHGYYNGVAWVFETLDGNGGANGRTTADVGWYNSVMLYNGRPHVFYRDATNNDLRHGYWNGSFWAFETLDGNGGGNGQTMNAVGHWSAPVVYNGRPHVFYKDTAADNLRHAYYNGFFWAFETLDGHQNGPNGRVLANVGQFNTALLYKGLPHVFYYAVTGGDLRHAYYTGSAWGFETLDGHQNGPNGRIDASVGQYADAVLYGDRPRVYYQDQSEGNLRHAYYTGSAWGFETLDGHQNGPNGRVNSVVGYDVTSVVYAGGPHVFNMQSSGVNLRHAYFG